MVASRVRGGPRLPLSVGTAGGSCVTSPPSAPDADPGSVRAQSLHPRLQGGGQGSRMTAGAAVAAAGPQCRMSPRLPTVPPPTLTQLGKTHSQAWNPHSHLNLASCRVPGAHEHPAEGTARSRGTSPGSSGFICAGLAGREHHRGSCSHPGCCCGPRPPGGLGGQGGPPNTTGLGVSLLLAPTLILERGRGQARVLLQPSRVCTLRAVPRCQSPATSAPPDFGHQ